MLLARRMATTRSLAVVTCRDDELSADHPLRLVLGGLAAAGVERLRLSPLSIDAVRELAASHQVDPEELFRRTGGNPFYVTEVLAAGGSELPPSVRDAVVAHAAQLDSGARALLEAVSIVPGTVPLALVTALGREHAVRLNTCLASGMLVESRDGISFRHTLAARRHRGWDRAAAPRRAAPDRARDAAGPRCRRGAVGAPCGGSGRRRRDRAVRADRGRAGHARGVRIARRRRSTGGRCAVGPSCRTTGTRDLLQRGAHASYLIDRFAEAIEWLRAAVELRRQAGDVRGETRRAAPALSRPTLWWAQHRRQGHGAGRRRTPRRGGRRSGAGGRVRQPGDAGAEQQRLRRLRRGGRSGPRAGHTVRRRGRRRAHAELARHDPPAVRRRFGAGDVAGEPRPVAGGGPPRARRSRLHPPGRRRAAHTAGGT